MSHRGALILVWAMVQHPSRIPFLWGCLRRGWTVPISETAYVKPNSVEFREGGPDDDDH